MAGNRASIVTPAGGFSVSGGTDKTLLSLTAGANVRDKITGVQVYFNGTVSNAPDIEVVLKRQTAGTGTSTGAVTPAKLDTISETIQSTAAYGYTAEPTAGVILQRWFVHPQQGQGRELPMTREWWIAGGGQVGLCCNNSGTALGAHGVIEFEE